MEKPVTSGAPGSETTPASPAEQTPDSSSRVTAGSSLRAQADLGRDTKLTELALAARAGEPDAIRAFLEAAAPTVRGVCRSVLGANHPELDDTIQECLIAILRALPKYRAEGPAWNYAKTIALHRAIAARKHGRNRERKLLTFVEEASVHTFDVHVEALPSIHVIREVIDELPAVQAEAILMRTILGFSMEEIALATQVSVNTAKSRLRVAKESLRRQLDQKQSAVRGQG